jgi:hypothetical protein
MIKGINGNLSEILLIEWLPESLTICVVVVYLVSTFSVDSFSDE